MKTNGLIIRPTRRHHIPIKCQLAGIIPQETFDQFTYDNKRTRLP